MPLLCYYAGKRILNTLSRKRGFIASRNEPVGQLVMSSLENYWSLGLHHPGAISLHSYSPLFSLARPASLSLQTWSLVATGWPLHNLLTREETSLSLCSSRLWGDLQGISVLVKVTCPLAMASHHDWLGVCHDPSPHGVEKGYAWQLPPGTKWHNPTQ